MFTDEFAEKVAALVAEKLNDKKEKMKKPPKVTKVEKRLLKALKRAQEEQGGSVDESAWRDVYRQLFSLPPVHVRMDFFRSKDKLLRRELVENEGFSYRLKVTREEQI